jgi:hypothetical protein
MADIELTEQISIFFFRALETDILKSSIGRKNPGRELTYGGKGVNLAGIYVYFPSRRFRFSTPLIAVCTTHVT